MSDATTYNKETLAPRIGVSRPTLDKMLLGRRLPKATEPADRPRLWTEPAIAAWEEQTAYVMRVAEILTGLAAIRPLDEFFRELARKAATAILDVTWQLDGRAKMARVVYEGVPWLAGFDLDSAPEYRMAVLKLIRNLDRFTEAGLLLRGGTEADRKRAEKILGEVLR